MSTKATRTYEAYPYFCLTVKLKLQSTVHVLCPARLESITSGSDVLINTQIARQLK